MSEAKADQPRAAAVVVKHRGISVHIYGPLADRKREVYLLAYHVGSRREKQTVKGTLADAQRKAKEVANGISAGDVVDGLHLTPLDRRVYLTAKEAAAPTGRAVDVLCRDAARALAALPAGSSLDAAVAFFARHHAPGAKSPRPSEVIEELYASLHALRRSATTIRTLRSIYARFGSDFQISIGSITTTDLEQWINANPGHSPRTQRNYINALVRLFNFAKKKKYLTSGEKTAAEQLEKPSRDLTRKIEIYHPWELERLLALAPDKLRACIAIGAFAGLRTIELARLDWSAIHLAEDGTASAQYPHGYVEVKASAAKKHRAAARRIIPIQPNLAAWLEPFRFSFGPVSPYRSDRSLSDALTDFTAQLNRAQGRSARASISRPENGLRHSYGSYRLPVINDVARLALEMNNSPAEIFESYRELVHPRDVESWWKIAPVVPSQIVQMELLG